MEHLNRVSLAELQDALGQVDEKKPALRLVAAIAHNQGISQSELAEWFDVERKTIYNWLTRLDDRDLVDAARDRPRPGRPRKLAPGEFEELIELLQSPCDAGDWTVSRVQHLIDDRYGVTYSTASSRRLMKEAGLRPTRSQSADAGLTWSLG